MDLLPPIAPTPATATLAPQPTITIGAAAPAAPIEPARRVTASRDTGKSDLLPQPASRGAAATPQRGRLIDLLV